MQKRFQERQLDLANRALELARRHPKDPVAIDALAWVVQHGRPPLVGQALDILGRDDIESDRLREALRWARYTVGSDTLAAERFLREVMARNPHRTMQGWACFYLAGKLESLAGLVRYLDGHPKERKRLEELYGAEVLDRLSAQGADTMSKESERLFERTVEQYAAFETPLPNTTLGDVARGRLFSMRNLAVGKTVPEIEGADVDGTRFKLSDYRSKVVLLTFSGNWCGPCQGMYPQERRLVERFQGKPFAMLSVDTDEDKATLRKSIEAKEITWRCWWDGGIDGPITKTWGIEGFPTIFLIDHRGVIRNKNSIAEDLDEAVERLVKEAEAKP